MAAPKLTIEQRTALLEWFAAEYSGPLIKKWFTEREWPSVSDATLSYYRDKWRDEISAAREARRGTAMTTGLALKEERVLRLADHADELEAIKWVPDEKGRLWNEKAWRETLEDIAKETGGRRAGIDLDVIDKEREAILDRLKNKLPDEVYAHVLAVIASSES